METPMPEPETPMPEPERWWQRWEWLLAVGVTMFAVAAMTIAITARRTSGEVSDQTDVLEAISRVVEGLDDTARGLEQNQEDLDVLVDYVNELRARDDDGDDGESEQLQAVFRAVLETRILVCSSSDPALRDACAALQENDP